MVAWALVLALLPCLRAPRLDEVAEKVTRGIYPCFDPGNAAASYTQCCELQDPGCWDADGLSLKTAGALRLIKVVRRG